MPEQLTPENAADWKIKQIYDLVTAEAVDALLDLIIEDRKRIAALEDRLQAMAESEASE